MATTRVEPGFDQDRSHAGRPGLSPDVSRVLIAGQSQINRIVVSRIVERCGLKPVTEPPASALRILPLIFPGLVILDGGADNCECDMLIPGILSLRRISGRDLPAVILLSNRTGRPDGPLALMSTVDAVVSKPFTTEQLQPVVDGIARRMRG